MLFFLHAGGSAITCKNELETINEDNLSIVSSQLRQGMISEPCHGMDWSRRPGSTNIQTVVDKFDDKLESQCKWLIVVHGAGSHFDLAFSYLLTEYECFLWIVVYHSSRWMWVRNAITLSKVYECVFVVIFNWSFLFCWLNWIGDMRPLLCAPLLYL